MLGREKECRRTIPNRTTDSPKQEENDDSPHTVVEDKEEELEGRKACIMHF